MTLANYLTALAVAYALVGAFWAGCTHTYGALVWREIGAGERPWTGRPRRYYLVTVPLQWFFFWPVKNLLANRVIEKERRPPK
jgi:hypothetical protein